MRASLEKVYVRDQLETAEQMVLSTRREQPKSGIPVFDLQEIEGHYLMAIDLPSAPISETEIEVRGDLLEVLMNCQDNIEKKDVLFRCSRRRQGIQAKYQDGILWILLPKTEPQIFFEE